MSSPIKNPENNSTAADSVSGTTANCSKANGSFSETRQMLEDVTQGIPESILLLSTDYKILWVNKATVHQTGFEEHELIGACCYKAIHGSDTHCGPPSNPCPVQELVKTGQPVTTVHEHHGKNGNTVYAEVSAYPIKDDAGNIVRFVHISRDITESMNLEKEREMLISELQDALVQIKTLKGIIPICTSCKKIRNHNGSWEQIESYIHRHSEAEFSHGMCPHCVKTHYPDHAGNMGEDHNI